MIFDLWPLAVLALIVIAYCNPKKWPRGLRHYLAKHGKWTYYGLRGMHPEHWPEGFVRYPDGGCTVNMALGNAYTYKSLFGGEVYDAGEVPPHCQHGHKDWDDCPVCCH